MSSRGCGKCRKDIPSWDPHPWCYNCRGCSRSARCASFCVGLAETHFDALEGKLQTRARGVKGPPAGSGVLRNTGAPALVPSTSSPELVTVTVTSASQGLVGHGGSEGLGAGEIPRCGVVTVPQPHPLATTGGHVYPLNATGSSVIVTSAATTGGGTVVTMAVPNPVMSITGGGGNFPVVVPPATGETGRTVSGPVAPQAGYPIDVGHSLVVNAPPQMVALQGNYPVNQSGVLPTSAAYLSVMNGQPLMAGQANSLSLSGGAQTVVGQQPAGSYPVQPPANLQPGLTAPVGQPVGQQGRGGGLACLLANRGCSRVAVLSSGWVRRPCGDMLPGCAPLVLLRLTRWVTSS